MALSKMEKERVLDSRLKIQSVVNSLRAVDPAQIPDYEEIEECLDDAEKSLRQALRASPSESERE